MKTVKDNETGRTREDRMGGTNRKKDSKRKSDKETEKEADQ